MVKQGNMPLSWEGLKQEMNLAFISLLVLDRYHEQWYELSQKGMIVRDYIKRFLRLSMYVEGLNKNMKMKKFINGLEYSIKADV